MERRAPTDATAHDAGAADASAAVAPARPPASRSRPRGGASAKPESCASPAPTPFVDDYLAALLGQAAQLIQGEFHRVVRDHGFSVSEWRVLATLADGQAMTTGRLAEISLTKGPTATRLLDRMVARGQVERLPDAVDRRVTRIRITPDGQRTVSNLIALAREHEARVLAPFGLDQAEALKATLRGLIEWRRGGEGRSGSKVQR